MAQQATDIPQQSPYSEVVLLLGAGASVEAGAPTVTQLVDRFANYVGERYPELAQPYEDLRDILEQSGPVAQGKALVDIELLLTALTLLVEQSENPLSAFVHSWKAFVANNKEAFPKLQDALQEHIRKECTVSADNIEYLRPLGDFVRHFGRLDIFTLNYDSTVELVLQKEEHSYTDGFDMYWNPALLDSLAHDVRLFKLHGSLLWFITSGSPRRLVKIPVRALEKLPEFFSEERVGHNLIYPVLTKEQHVEPYATLMNHLRRALSQAKLLITIGCSFRDAYLKQVVVERMIQNRDLRVVVVDPDAAKVISRSDSMLDDRWAFASVPDRVSAFPSEAGAALTGRLLLDRTVAMKDLPRLQDEHVHSVLQHGPGQGPTQGYTRRLVDLRLMSEIQAACQNRAAGHAAQDALMSRIGGVGFSNPEFGNVAPVAIYLSAHATIDKIKTDARQWLESRTNHFANYVGYHTSDYHVFLTDPNTTIPPENGQRLFQEREKLLTDTIKRMSACLSTITSGVPADVVMKSQALLETLQSFCDYFNSGLGAWPSFTNYNRRRTQVPLVANEQVLEEMASRLDEQGCKVLATILGT